MKKRGKGNTEWVEKPPGKICGEAMQLLEAERYEIYPTHYYTRSSFRKQGHEEIGLSCILLKAVYGAVNPGSLYGDLLEPTGGVLIPFPALNSGYIALPILIPFVALWGGPTSSHVHLIENGCTYHCFRCSCATLSLLEHLCSAEGPGFAIRPIGGAGGGDGKRTARARFVRAHQLGTTRW